MKILFAALASASLLCGGAMAQDQDQNQEHHNPQGHHDQGSKGGSGENGGQNNGGSPENGEKGGSTMMQGPGAMGHRQSGEHRNFDVHQYQRAFNAPHRFHAGAWHPPQGYTYRRWNYGDRLPPIYFVRDYWIPDFAIYGLVVPPPDCVWVRYGPDALLVDEDSGEIIQVEYDVFF